MRKGLKTPRIVKIEKIGGFIIQCMFNNGESRILNFNEIFEKWKVDPNDIEYPLLNLEEFRKVELRNNTLSWPNIEVAIVNENGISEKHPYEIGPDVLFELSDAAEVETRHMFGNMIKKAREKAGLTQQQLALRSGTTRFYISKIENNRTDIELSTFRKIVEAGLGRNLIVSIE